MSTIQLLNLPDMSDTDKILKLEAELNSCRLWQAEHDGRINAYWAAQHKWNEDHENEAGVERTDTHKKIAHIDRRLTAVEKKIIWITAAAAAGGGAIGPIIQALSGG